VRGSPGHAGTGCATSWRARSNSPSKAFGDRARRHRGPFTPITACGPICAIFTKHARSRHWRSLAAGTALTAIAVAGGCGGSGTNSGSRATSTSQGPSTTAGANQPATSATTIVQHRSLLLVRPTDLCAALDQQLLSGLYGASDAAKVHLGTSQPMSPAQPLDTPAAVDIPACAASVQTPWISRDAIEVAAFTAKADLAESYAELNGALTHPVVPSATGVSVWIRKGSGGPCGGSILASDGGVPLVVQIRKACDESVPGVSEAQMVAAWEHARTSIVG
jgi:hypothetical protein